MGTPHTPQLFELAAIELEDLGADEDRIIDFIHDQASAAHQMLNRGDITGARAAVAAIRQALDDLTDE